MANNYVQTIVGSEMEVKYCVYEVGRGEVPFQGIPTLRKSNAPRKPWIQGTGVVARSQCGSQFRFRPF